MDATAAEPAPSLVDTAARGGAAPVLSTTTAAGSAPWILGTVEALAGIKHVRRTEATEKLEAS
jgi:hypothetical protein